ncbi:MAG TPA: glycine--tRNA ligase subunit beta, partial [Thermoanaerobaculia bacterium]|nr:glycine--tRNA ligase subunit beta [Thermoanaerobaculia bacterium]
MKRHDYFFEILTEEIPAWMLRTRLGALRSDLSAVIAEISGVAPGGDALEVDATSRRIFFRIADLPERQADREEEIKGPPESAAFDAEGNPTRALEGFLRKNEVPVDRVERRAKYIWVRRIVPGRTAAEVLAARVPPLIEGMRWPKMMRFDGHSWIRPVHSVISILGGDEVPIEIFGLRSGRSTRGHRTRSDRAMIEIRSGADYAAKLRETNVVVNAEERVEVMRAASERL